MHLCSHQCALKLRCNMLLQADVSWVLQYLQSTGLLADTHCPGEHAPGSNSLMFLLFCYVVRQPVTMSLFPGKIMQQEQKHTLLLCSLQVFILELGHLHSQVASWSICFVSVVICLSCCCLQKVFCPVSVFACTCLSLHDYCLT